MTGYLFSILSNVARFVLGIHGVLSEPESRRPDSIADRIKNKNLHTLQEDYRSHIITNDDTVALSTRSNSCQDSVMEPARSINTQIILTRKMKDHNSTDLLDPVTTDLHQVNSIATIYQSERSSVRRSISCSLINTYSQLRSRHILLRSFEKSRQINSE